MIRFFNVIRFNVRNLPYVRRIFAEWIPGQFAFVGSFEVFFARVFGRNSDRIQVERVVVRLCEPKNNLVTTGKSFRAVKPVTEMPSNSIPQF